MTDSIEQDLWMFNVVLPNDNNVLHYIVEKEQPKSDKKEVVNKPEEKPNGDNEKPASPANTDVKVEKMDVE